MKKRLTLTFCLLLAGCSDADWDHVLNYGGREETESAPVTVARPTPQSAAAAVSAAAPAEPANAEFCRSVAAQDASTNGFDPATQTRVYAQSYAQCVAIYSR